MLSNVVHKAVLGYANTVPEASALQETASNHAYPRVQAQHTYGVELEPSEVGRLAALSRGIIEPVTVTRLSTQALPGTRRRTYDLGVRDLVTAPALRPWYPTTVSITSMGETRELRPVEYTIEGTTGMLHIETQEKVVLLESEVEIVTTAYRYIGPLVSNTVGFAFAPPPAVDMLDPILSHALDAGGTDSTTIIVSGVRALVHSHQRQLPLHANMVPVLDQFIVRVRYFDPDNPTTNWPHSHTITINNNRTYPTLLSDLPLTIRVTAKGVTTGSPLFSSSVSGTQLTLTGRLFAPSDVEVSSRSFVHLQFEMVNALGTTSAVNVLEIPSPRTTGPPETPSGLEATWSDMFSYEAYAEPMTSVKQQQLHTSFNQYLTFTTARNTAYTLATAATPTIFDAPGAGSYAPAGTLVGGGAMPTGSAWLAFRVWPPIRRPTNYTIRFISTAYATTGKLLGGVGNLQDHYDGPPNITNQTEWRVLNDVAGNGSATLQDRAIAADANDTSTYAFFAFLIQGVHNSNLPGICNFHVRQPTTLRIHPFPPYEPFTHTNRYWATRILPHNVSNQLVLSWNPAAADKNGASGPDVTITAIEIKYRALAHTAIPATFKAANTVATLTKTITENATTFTFSSSDIVFHDGHEFEITSFRLQNSQNLWSDAWTTSIKLAMPVRLVKSGFLPTAHNFMTLPQWGQFVYNTGITGYSDVNTTSYNQTVTTGNTKMLATGNLTFATYLPSNWSAQNSVTRQVFMDDGTGNYSTSLISPESTSFTLTASTPSPGLTAGTISNVGHHTSYPWWTRYSAPVFSVGESARALPRSIQFRLTYTGVSPHIFTPSSPLLFVPFNFSPSNVTFSMNLVTPNITNITGFSILNTNSTVQCTITAQNLQAATLAIAATQTQWRIERANGNLVANYTRTVTTESGSFTSPALALSSFINSVPANLVYSFSARGRALNPKGSAVSSNATISSLYIDQQTINNWTTRQLNWFTVGNAATIPSIVNFNDDYDDSGTHLSVADGFNSINGSYTDGKDMRVVLNFITNTAVKDRFYRYKSTVAAGRNGNIRVRLTEVFGAFTTPLSKTDNEINMDVHNNYWSLWIRHKPTDNSANWTAWWNGTAYNSGNVISSNNGYGFRCFDRTAAVIAQLNANSPGGITLQTVAAWNDNQIDVDIVLIVRTTAESKFRSMVVSNVS